jgi:hypothetical protein
VARPAVNMKQRRRRLHSSAHVVDSGSLTGKDLKCRGRIDLNIRLPTHVARMRRSYCCASTRRVEDDEILAVEIGGARISARWRSLVSCRLQSRRRCFNQLIRSAWSQILRLARERNVMSGGTDEWLWEYA